ncbi:MAG: peptide chain release factor N(5)-glutamine methyltransferase [Deltaproteobacteria bacterium]|nr:peptide chain release factor N(5)-glutamine methyltransferase [Nannocystaceae bacterium]
MSDSPPRAPAPPAGPSGTIGEPSGAARSDASAQIWTIGELLRWTQQRFAAIGIGEARLDAERLLAHALGCARMTLYTEHDRPVDDAARGRFRELVRRRLGREPVAYIEGRRGFHALDLELAVDARVLVPRPETEHLVDWMLEDLRASDAAHVLDVGTGSGAIALAIKHARPELDVLAIDVSAGAVEVARGNAERLELAVVVHRSDLLGELELPDSGFTAIAANLPYIPTAELAELEPEVARHEPTLALDGGVDGLAVIDRLLAQVIERGALAAGGAIYLEVGHDQAPAVVARLLALGLAAETRNDYAGIARVVRGRRE